MNIKTALKPIDKGCLKSTLFPVEEVPAYWGLNKKNMSTEHKFIVRKDTNEVISCMTNDYKLVTNEEVFEKANDYICNLNGILSEAQTFKDGAVTQYKWVFPDFPIDVGRLRDAKDIVYPSVDIINSYNGTVALTTMAGHWRLVCTNGAIIGVIIQKGKTRHLNGMMDIIKLEKNIKESVDSVHSHFGHFAAHLQEKKFKLVTDLPKIMSFFPHEQGDYIVQKILSEKPTNWWDLYNIITNVFTHHSSRSHRTVREREGGIFKDVLKMSGYESKDSEVYIA